MRKFLYIIEIIVALQRVQVRIYTQIRIQRKELRYFNWLIYSPTYVETPSLKLKVAEW